MSERSFRDNFHRMYQDNLCQLCKSGVDSQEHALSCIVFNEHLNQEDKATLKRVDYLDIFGDLQAQLCIAKIYQTLIRIKRRLLKPVDQPTSAYPGINSGPIGSDIFLYILAINGNIMYILTSIHMNALNVARIFQIPSLWISNHETTLSEEMNEVQHSHACENPHGY